ncbi:MAG: hypothetical protein BWX50_01112 [Euryarchaeota archaeon ADurb.Bin009]|nr:MAG: hypothetical protein BWX50_01112 [Euryarchaeota archaeon ADurb.Bin009]
MTVVPRWILWRWFSMLFWSKARRTSTGVRCAPIGLAEARMMAKLCPPRMSEG